MRLSRTGYGPLLVAAIAFAVIGTACGDSDVEPDRTTSVTTAAPPTGVTTTAAPSPDGLDCDSDERVSAIGEPAPEFAGHATPEEAVLAAASNVSVSGSARLLEGDTWVIVSDAGLTIARANVEPWQEGWWAGEILACSLTESETGRIVGQSVMVEGVWVAVSAEGVVSFVVSGTVPSSCHEAVVGFEEPNADGILIGSAESWLDPSCTVTDEPAPFRLTAPVPGLAEGEYTVRLPGAGDRHFAIPNVGRVDGPVLVSPLPESDVLEGMAAEVKGTVLFDSDSGCLLLELEGVRYPLVWPAGTSWRSDPPGVRLEDGQVVEPGMTVYGGGGYLDRGGIEWMAGAAVADAAEACVGPTGEIAIFNIGSDVIITSD